MSDSSRSCGRKLFDTASVVGGVGGGVQLGADATPSPGDLRGFGGRWYERIIEAQVLADA